MVEHRLDFVPKIYPSCGDPLFSDYKSAFSIHFRSHKANTVTIRMGSHTQPVDMVGARVQNKKAADKGHGDAQYNLALMLANGLGGPVDMAGARVQYKKAADQGHWSLSTPWRICSTRARVDL